MKLFFLNIWKYIAIFFVGVAAALVYAMKQIKPDQPIINADSYIAAQEQNIGKLNQRGEGNTQDVSQPAAPTRRELRKERRAKRREARLQEETAKEEAEQSKF